MKFILLFLFFFSIHPVYSQYVVTGVLRDEKEKPISDVSISFRKIGSPLILGFTRSDSRGMFKIDLGTNQMDSLRLIFNHMSYAREEVSIPAKAGTYGYILKNEVRELKEFNISGVPFIKVRIR